MSTATKRIREAEKTVEQARETLENAEAGLYAAERLAEVEDGHRRRRPLLKASMWSAILSAIGFFLARKQRARS